MFENRGSRTFSIPPVEKPVGRTLRLPLSVPLYPRRENRTDASVVAVLTLCACTPPLDQVLKLWDFLLAFGVHLNVLCVIAQLLLIREEVMSSSR